MSRPYTLRQIKLGCEVTGVQLSQILQCSDTVEMIKRDVRDQRLLVFKHQENITPEVHLAVGRWFGEIE